MEELPALLRYDHKIGFRFRCSLNAWISHLPFVEV